MAETPAGPLYATFARRVRALVLDGLVLLGALLLVVCLAAAVQFGQTARVALFIGLVLTVVLYEAVAVSVWGCTIGQRLSNLRVVAPTPNGRLPVTATLFGSVLHRRLANYHPGSGGPW